MNVTLHAIYVGLMGVFLGTATKGKKESGNYSATSPGVTSCLGKCCNRGYIFAATGGEHFTSDDMSKVAKIPAIKEKL